MACAIGICSSLQSQTDTSFSGAKQSKSAAKARPGVVKKLDGTKLFGFVEITDDYTIRITNDSGIARFPIAQLSEADFQKYGFRKNRSQDGRFWYERKEALKTSEENPKSQNNATSGRKSVAEIRVAEITAFQPFIAAYEKTLASKSGERSTVTNRARRGARHFRCTIQAACFPSQAWEVPCLNLGRA